MKSKREHWPVPNRVEQRSRALQTSVLATETLAANWIEKAEQHRALAFQLAHDSLKEAAKKGLPIENWRDADLADKTARRNAGLDSEEGSRIQIGLALIETRLQAINLPKDTPNADGLNELQYGPAQVKPIQNPLALEALPDPAKPAKYEQTTTTQGRTKKTR